MAPKSPTPTKDTMPVGIYKKTYCKICNRKQKTDVGCDPANCDNAGSNSPLEFSDFKPQSIEIVEDLQCEKETSTGYIGTMSDYENFMGY